MKKLCKTLTVNLCFITTYINISFSQQTSDQIYNQVSLSDYLSGVLEGNLGYIAGKLNVTIAEAELKASKIFPDPEISVAYSNNEDKTLQMGQSVEAGISYPVSLGNRRRAGIALARSQYELSQMMLDVYFRNLRAEAAFIYFEALRNQKINLLQKEIYDQLSQLARTDSIRSVAGEVSSLDAMQSSLEARSQLSEVYQSLSDMQNSYLKLMTMQGKKYSDTLDNPSGNFPLQNRDFKLNDLIATAVENRSELIVAIKNKEVSEKHLKMLKAERSPEISIEAGYSYNTVVRNEIAPAPEYNGLSAGISLPLKFSGLNKGSLQAADLAVKQSLTLYEETELQITTEVVQAYNNFVAQRKKASHYNPGLIDDAGKILQGRIYSYQHGESGLIDVLNAQRTYIELRINHLDALFEYTLALIELERASGIWDITE